MDGQDEGHWRSGCCFEPWGWGTEASKRLIVIGFASEKAGFEDGYSFALIGDTREEGVSDPIELRINFLKTATTLRYLAGRSVTEQNLLAALTETQAAVERKFPKGTKEVRPAYSCKVEEWQCDQSNVNVICQSPALSLPGPGRRFLVIDPKLMPSDVQVIDKAYLHFLLDLSGATYAVEDTRVGPKAHATKAIKAGMLASPGFAAGRMAIQRSMAAL